MTRLQNTQKMSNTIRLSIKDEYKVLFDNEEFTEAWNDWRSICKKKGSVESVRSWNRHLGKLKVLAKDDVGLMIKILDQSSDGGPKGAWTKLYNYHGDTLRSETDY